MYDGANKVIVDLKDRSYPVQIGYDVWPECIVRLKEKAKEKEVFIVSDSNVYKLYGNHLKELLHNSGFSIKSYVIDTGEKSKSWVEAGNILEKMLSSNLGRKAPVIALGGGVVGDLTGFVAALYRRGVPLIQVPTSLLAQVDSSIGGKVAVNHPLGKNMLGTFYQPSEVWINLSTLNSLPQEEWKAGLAEVLKYAIIWDYDFFVFIENNIQAILEKDKGVIPEIVQRCCSIKASVVSEDEKDEGLRNILNFGHTIGHAIEKATLFQRYRHGEAVAIGIMGALYLAKELNMIMGDEIERIKRVLKQWGLPIKFPAKLIEEVEQAMHFDKKVIDKKLVFVLPNKIGKVSISKDIPKEPINKALAYISE